MSLVVWLPFNNSTNNQGTSTCNLGSGSPSYSTGKVTRYCLNSGGWMNYNSSNLVIPMTTTGTFSMGAWIKNKDISVSTNAWVFVIGEGDNVCKGLWNGTGYTTNLHWAYSTSGQNISTSINTQDGNWHHIFFVNDKPNTTCTLWVDGQKQGSITLNSNGLNACTEESVKVNSTYYAVNDFRIYNHCLSAKEIKELSRGLALHYKFNFEDLYVPVEYIQSSGTQWIQTGLMSSDFSSKIIKCDISFYNTASSSRAYSTIIGCQQNLVTLLRIDSGTMKYFSNNSSQAYSGSVSSSNNYTVSYTTNYNNNTTSITVNGTTTSASSTASWGTNTVGIMLLASHNGGSPWTDELGLCRIYYCKFYDNDVLVRNFIPCIRKCDSKPGLFDLVNNVFYTNSGTGEFTYPSATITNTIIDCSGYGLNGTPSNITTTTTNIGTSAISFNGSSSKIDYNYLPLTSNMTYVLWMKFNSTASAHIIDNRATSGETGYQPMYGGTTYGLQCHSSNGGSYTWSSATCGFTTGVWYHLAVVITPSNATLYINGVSKGTQSGTFGSEIGARLMRLGARCSNANWFNGVMSELRVYETALSASDILELYQAKESIDKNGNLYCNSINELGNSISFKKNSVIECNSIIEGFSRTSLQGAYTQLEYIKTNGNQIINTGVADTLRTTVDLDMQVDSGIGQYWYGSTQNSGGMMYNGLYNITALEYNWLTISRTSNNSCIMTQRLNGNNITITMNGVTSTVSVGSTAPTGNLYIFGCNNGNRYYGTGILCRYFRIYQDNVLVRDFIPVKRNKDNAIGMLDLVHNTFYANAGTGSFTAGNEINKKYAIYTNNIIEN